MFNSIKSLHQQRILRLLSSLPRQKRIANLDQMNDIAVIFNVGPEREWNQLYAFVREMEQRQKRVYLVGYQPHGMEISYIFTHPRTSILHQKEDLTFFGLPKEGVAEGFLNRHYDLLIDLTADHTFLARYLAGKALADLKVCYLHQQDDPQMERLFDLLIRGDKPLEYPHYLNLVKQYLSIIKK